MVILVLSGVFVAFVIAIRLIGAALDKVKFERTVLEYKRNFTFSDDPVEADFQREALRWWVHEYHFIEDDNPILLSQSTWEEEVQRHANRLRSADEDAVTKYSNTPTWAKLLATAEIVWPAIVLLLVIVAYAFSYGAEAIMQLLSL